MIILVAEKPETELDWEEIADEIKREWIFQIGSQGNWMEELREYLKNGTLPEDPVKVKRLLARAPRFTLLENELYKRSFGGPMLKCLTPEKALYVMREVHEGSCGNHSGGRSLAQKMPGKGIFGRL